MLDWPETMLLEFNTTDYRQYVSLDSADPFRGRHAARINAPNDDLLMMPVKTTIDSNFSKGVGGAGRYRVRFAARSSPGGASVGATFTQYAPHGPKIMGPPSYEALARQSSDGVGGATVLGTEWRVVEALVDVTLLHNCSAPDVLCGKIPLQIWARSPFGTGALIGIDEISVFRIDDNDGDDGNDGNGNDGSGGE